MRQKLVHGMVQVHDMAVDPGGVVVDEDWYRVATLPYSSYEILAEGLTGDLYLTPRRASWSATPCRRPAA